MRVFSEAEARERADPSSARRRGPAFNVRLVYWSPPFGTGPGRSAPSSRTTLLPWYSCIGTVERPDRKTGRVATMRTRERFIPATDDRSFVPSVRLVASAAQRTTVEASVEVTGGRGPYAYVWAGSNPAASASSGSSIRYTPMTRLARSGALPPASETVRANETVSVAVIDANGVSVQVTQTLVVEALPFRPGPRHFPPAPSYGCESPADPGEWTLERVGWQNGMSTPGAGGGTEKFCWLGDDSWPGDYIRPAVAGTLPAEPWIYGDADYSNWGINTANLVLINGDGWPEGFTAMYPGAPLASYTTSSSDVLRPGNPGGTVEMPVPANPTEYAVPYAGSWGPMGPNDRLYWLAGLLCDVLDETDGGGLSAVDRWGPAFGGLHIFTGFDSGANYSAGAFPQGFAESLLGVSGPPQTIVQAWFSAAAAQGIGTPAAMGPIDANGVSDYYDYYPGKGSMGPTIPPAQVAGWWYVIA